jgi:stearoyl-CoA desaturase (delta-9 desaturase)
MLQEEKKRAGKSGRLLLRRARTALIRDTSILKQSQKLRLASVLENFQSLRTAYQYRVNLQEIWNRRSASQKELLEALQEWCRQAEATGIEALRRFSIQLKTYVPQ